MIQLFRLLSIRHLLAAPLRSLVTLLGVAIGVATLVGITSVNASVMSAFRSTVDTVAGKADLTVAGTPAGFDEGTVERVRSIPGVLHASGALTIVAPVAGFPGERLMVLGVDFLDDGFFRDFEGIDRDLSHVGDDLEFLNSTDRLLVSERFAEGHQLKAGDRFGLLTADGRREFTVHGLLRESGAVKAFGGSIAVMYLDSAQEAFHRSGKVDRIDLAIDPKVGTDEVRRRIQAAIGPAFEVDRPAQRGGSVEKMVRSFQMGLNMGSAVALLVGIFLVYNTVSIAVVQRRREIGTLRALGATRFRVRFLFTLEALVLGSLGTVLGIPMGSAIARGAIRRVAGSISSLYVQVNPQEVRVGAREIVLAASLGVLGSAIAALRPAYHASRVQPVEALRRDFAAGVAVGSWRVGPVWLGAVLLVLALPVTWLPAPVENLALGGYLAVFFVLMGLSLVSPVVLSALRVAYVKPAEWLLGVSGRLAAENFSRTPARTAVPVSALMVGVAMAICVAAFIGSFRASATKWIDQSVPADLFVTSSSKLAGIRNTPMQPEFGAELRSLPGVLDVDHVRIFPTDAMGLRISLVSMMSDVYGRHGKLSFLEGDHLPTLEEQRREGKVMVSENLARRRDLHLGSPFSIPSPTGVHTYTVGAVVVDYTSDQGAVFMDRQIFVEQFEDSRVDSFELYLNDPSRAEALRRTINERFGEQRDLYVLTNAELHHEAMNLIDEAFAVTYAMEIVAVLLALLGVINSLLAAVLDRTREIGLLRAIGAGYGHVIRLFTAEAGLMGVSGGSLGLLGGAWLGYLITRVVGLQTTGWYFPYVFPWQLAARMLTLATVCAMAAGLYPARRAARLNVVEALAYE